MAVVKIFKCEREREEWKYTIGHLNKEVYSEYSPADVSIVLDGRYENPTVLDGKKILITQEFLWKNTWNMFMAILPEYYDEIIKIIGNNVNMIKRVYKREVEKS